jgi:ribonuclease P/MRP protein subunit RPP40
MEINCVCLQNLFYPRAIIDDDIISMILKFADDTKLIKLIATLEDAITLQSDLAKMFEWSKDWQMLFNVDKCKVIHFGYYNIGYDYYMGENLLEVVHEEKDLGITIHDSLSNSTHCANAVKKANSALGLINRTVEYKDKFCMLKFYKELVRPHLEYCVQAWRPYKQKDIDLIEGVQRRATRMIEGYKDLSYPERLKRCKLTTLECRRLRGDLIETFKLFNGYEDIDPGKFFPQNNTVETRGHNWKIFKKLSKLDIRKYSFTQRVVNYWNDLPENVVSATSINIFKNRLDDYMRHMGGLYISLSRLSTPATRPTEEL